MNFDSLVSVLVRSDWAFLTIWILLLVVAYVASFPEKARGKNGQVKAGPTLT